MDAVLWVHQLKRVYRPISYSNISKQHGHLQKYQRYSFLVRKENGWPFTSSWGQTALTYHICWIHNRFTRSLHNNCSPTVKDPWGEVLAFFSIQYPPKWKTLEIQHLQMAFKRVTHVIDIRASFAHVAGLARVPKASRLAAYVNLERHMADVGQRWPHQSAKFRRVPCSTVESLFVWS